MRVIDANGSHITPELLAQAMKDMAGDGISLRMPLEQSCAWENLSVHVNIVSESKEALSAIFRDPHPKTAMGIPIIEDTWMLPDRIRWEKNGVPIAGIVNLAVPQEY